MADVLSIPFRGEGQVYFFVKEVDMPDGERARIRKRLVWSEQLGFLQPVEIVGAGTPRRSLQLRDVEKWRRQIVALEDGVDDKGEPLTELTGVSENDIRGARAQVTIAERTVESFRKAVDAVRKEPENAAKVARAEKLRRRIAEALAFIGTPKDACERISREPQPPLLEMSAFEEIGKRKAHVETLAESHGLAVKPNVFDVTLRAG